MLDELSEGELTSIITTEHFTLQTARAAAIAQANGRATTYMGVLSSSLIALALVGQTTGLIKFFYVFGPLLFVPLAILGRICVACRVSQTTAGPIALVNGFPFAVLLGFMVEPMGADVRVLIPLGAIAFLLSVVAQYRHVMRAFLRLNRAFGSKAMPRTDE
jgi:hypothetical protein